MKVWYRPSGGRMGYGFDYFCSECGEYVGNSSASYRLEHAAISSTGFFKKKVTPLTCVNAGKVCEIPRHEIEAKEIGK